MIQMDSAITDVNALDEKIKHRMRNMNIADELFFDSEEIDSEEINVRNLHEKMNKVYQTLQELNASWEIKEPILASNRPIIGKAIVFCKKVYRKLTRWLLKPIYDQQTIFNSASVRTISDMIKVQEMMISILEEFESEVD